MIILLNDINNLHLRERNHESSAFCAASLSEHGLSLGQDFTRGDFLFKFFQKVNFKYLLENSV
jgi:hypothetical protein